MLRLILLRSATACCSNCNAKPQRRGQMAAVGGRHADPFSVVAINLSTSFAGGGAEGDLMRLMGWQDRAMLDRYGADLQVQRAIEAKRRRGEMY
jgi:hypothetical protein